MNRFVGKSWVVIASLAILVAMSQAADAQRDGRRGRGGFGRGRALLLTPVQLAAADDVQAAINVSAAQKDDIDQINDDLRQSRRDLLRGERGDFREMMDAMQKMNEEAAAKLAETLDDAQNKRLLGILAQVDVSAALNNSTIAAELSLTDEEKNELADIGRSNFQAFLDARRDLRDQDLSREERDAKLAEVRAEGNKKLLAALTTEQQAKYEDIKGEPVKMDTSQFYRFGGRRGGRDGRGGGGRGRGGRRDDSGESRDSGA